MTALHRRLAPYLWLGAFVTAGAIEGCDNKRPTPAPSPAAQDAAATTQTPALRDAKPIIAGACLSCHTEEMLAQQRLPKEKWAATVKKMAGWGANLDPQDTETLVTYLADKYGPDAGPWEPDSITSADTKAALAPQDDGVFAGGVAETGKQLYVERCSACHGPDARGGLGVNLVERPLLYRAADVGGIVRRGRGKMTPLPNMTDREIADVLAHLRQLRLP
jgi:cytochrome c oxidase cbb3-type subunit 3